MKELIFSSDGKTFCQFMTLNVPKPRFWNWALTFIFLKSTSSCKAQMQRPSKAHPGPGWSAFAGPIHGPGAAPWQGSSKAQIERGRTLRFQQGPSSIAPREKIHRSGDPRCDLWLLERAHRCLQQVRYHCHQCLWLLGLSSLATKKAPPRSKRHPPPPKRGSPTTATKGPTNDSQGYLLEPTGGFWALWAHRFL